MWQCKKCNFKNSNSSEKCHGIDCESIRPITEKEIKHEKEIAKVKKYKAFCRHCDKEVIVVKSGRIKFQVVWKCTTCRRRYFGMGKAEEIKNEVENITLLNDNDGQ